MPDSTPENESRAIGRRRFLTSLFGLRLVGEGQSAAEASSGGSKASCANSSFFWGDLHNGFIGFPTGTSVPAGLPGSLMKLVTAAAIAEEGVLPLDETLECRGHVTINHHTYNCLYAHGHVSLVRAIGMSCNAYFAQAAQKLSPSTIIDFTRRFGLSAPVDGRAPAQFPAKPGLDALPYALGLASDLRPNALQIMRLSALVATSGRSPDLHDAAHGTACGEGFKLTLKDGTWAALQQGMRLCAREGTAKKLDPEDKLRLAVKTGTAPHGKTFQSWITGYFPCDAPKHVFCLRAPAGTSQDAAVPQARQQLFAVEWP